jgi:nitrite reductase/ring-hydroxylating ferredoxin subunit
MNKLSRRDFMKVINWVLGITGLSILASPIIAYFWPKNLQETPTEPVSAGMEDTLLIGESVTVPFGRYPAIVINTPQGFRAYSAVCTHFACICKWDPAKNQIVCPCHDGFFDPFTGDVIAGPPPTGLQPFDVEIVDGEIFVNAGGEE